MYLIEKQLLFISEQCVCVIRMINQHVGILMCSQLTESAAVGSM